MSCPEYVPDPTERSVVNVTEVVLADVTLPSIYCVVGLVVTAARNLCPTAKPIDGVDVYVKALPAPISIELLLVDFTDITAFNPCTP